MFIAIPKSCTDQFKPLPVWCMNGKYVVAQSKGQAKRAIIQADDLPENYTIFQMEEVK